MRGISVCKRCIGEKIEIKGSYLPCMKYKKELTGKEPQNINSLLCQVGPYQWCTKFCNMSSRQLELRFLKDYKHIIELVEPLWQPRAQKK